LASVRELRRLFVDECHSCDVARAQLSRLPSQIAGFDAEAHVGLVVAPYHRRQAVPGKRLWRIEHDGLEIEGPDTRTKRTERLELGHVPLRNVCRLDPQVNVAIRPALLVEKADRVADLVDDLGDAAISGEAHELFPGLGQLADRRRASVARGEADPV